MSMLSEHKTRPSWVLNPRASEWSKDQNKLGQKMLEKMGWSAGKGLGAKEQGPVEALRVAYKGDARGLGATRKKEQDYWLQQQENFQSLLESLSGGDDQNVEVKSLEERSKSSKARVHYHKFTRGKDISRYSKKDLSCIVGGGAPAPKVIPASVICNTRQRSKDQLGSLIRSEDSVTPDCSKQRNMAEMRLQSRESDGENSIPVEKKKSAKMSSGDIVDVQEPFKSTDEDSYHKKIAKSKKSTEISNDIKELVKRRTCVEVGDDASQMKPKRSKKKRTAGAVNDEVEITQTHCSEKPHKNKKTRLATEELAEKSTKEGEKKGLATDTENEKKRKIAKEGKKLKDKKEDGTDQHEQSKKPRKNKKSKKDVSEEEDQCRSVPAERGKKKSRKETRVVEELVEKSTKENDGAQEENENKRKAAKGGKKLKDQKKASSNTETDQQPKKRSKRNVAATDERLKESGKSEKIKDEGVDLDDTREIHRSLDTDEGSLNSQSSLFDELINGKEQNAVDRPVRPECWYKNHILSQDSDEEVSSEEERMTGIPKKGKKLIT